MFQDATVVDMKKSGSVFAINPAETILVTGHLDGAIDVWRFLSGSPQTKLTGQQRKITNLVFSMLYSVLFVFMLLPLGRLPTFNIMEISPGVCARNC